MNKEAIKRVVHYLKTEITKDIITDFEITTNGTILDDELLEIFATNHFSCYFKYRWWKRNSRYSKTIYEWKRKLLKSDSEYPKDEEIKNTH